MLLDYTVSDVRVIALDDQTQAGVVLCICPGKLPEVLRDQIVRETQILLKKSHIVYVIAENEATPQKAFIWESIPNSLSDSEIMNTLKYSLQRIRSIIF